MKKEIKEFLKQVRVDDYEIKNDMRATYTEHDCIMHSGPAGSFTMIINGWYKRDD